MREPGRTAGGQRYFLDDGQLPRLHRPQRQRPLFRDVRLRRAVNYALDRPRSPRRSTTRRATRSCRRSVDGFPAGGVSSASTGHELNTARKLAATGSAMPSSTYCTFFPYGDTACDQIAPLVKADLARIGIDRLDRARRTSARGVRHGLEPRRPLLVTNFGTLVRDPLAYLDQALAAGRYALGARAGAVEQPVVPAPPRAAQRPCAARPATRTYVRLERELMRAAPFAVYGTFSGGQYVSTAHRLQGDDERADLLDLVALCPRHA